MAKKRRKRISESFSIEDHLWKARSLIKKHSVPRIGNAVNDQIGNTVALLTTARGQLAETEKFLMYFLNDDAEELATLRDVNDAIVVASSRLKPLMGRNYD